MNDIDMNVVIKVDKMSEFTTKMSKIFMKQIKNRLEEYDWNMDPEVYIVDCIKMAYKQQKIKELLGSYVRKKDEFPEYCVCCLEPIEIGQYKRRLPCNHVYHKKCIDLWLFKYNNDGCPYCRTKLCDVH